MKIVSTICIESFEPSRNILGESEAENDAVDDLLFRAYYAAEFDGESRRAITEKSIATLKQWRWLEGDRRAAWNDPWTGDLG